MRSDGFAAGATISANKPSLFQLMSRFFYQFTAQGKMSYQFYVQNEQSTNGVTWLRFGKRFETDVAVSDSLCASEGKLVISLPQWITPTNMCI
jgi:uncharacterized protein YpmS